MKIIQKIKITIVFWQYLFYFYLQGNFMLLRLKSLKEWICFSWFESWFKMLAGYMLIFLIDSTLRAIFGLFSLTCSSHHSLTGIPFDLNLFIKGSIFDILSRCFATDVAISAAHWKYLSASYAGLIAAFLLFPIRRTIYDPLQLIFLLWLL